MELGGRSVREKHNAGRGSSLACQPSRHVALSAPAARSAQMFGEHPDEIDILRHCADAGQKADLVAASVA